MSFVVSVLLVFWFVIESVLCVAKIKVNCVFIVNITKARGQSKRFMFVAIFFIFVPL